MAETEPAASAQSATQAAANLRAMGLMVLGMGAFVVNDGLMKVTSRELPLGEILALRGLICCLIMVPIVATTSGLAVVLRIYSWPVVARNVAEIGAVFAYLLALFQLPIASVSGVLQAVPLLMTALAALFLREPVGWRRWTAAAAGFVGVLLIIRPGSTEFSVWYLAAIAAVFCVAARDFATRFIPKSAPSFAITFITAVIVTVSGAALGLSETWVAPSFMTLMRLAGAAVLVLIGYWCLIEAMRTAEISVVSPFRYSVVLWAIMLGYLAFDEVPSAWTLIGSIVVVSAGLYTWHRERVAARRLSKAAVV